jgi:hypothetical protein
LDTTAKVWDLASGRALFTVPGHLGGIWSVAYSPDGRQFLTGGGDGENNGKLWDAETGRLVRTFPPRGGADWLESGPLARPREGHWQRVEVVAFSPDGKRVLSGSNDGRVIVWDTASGDSLLTLGQRSGTPIHAAAFSPDGLTIAIGTCGGKFALWKVEGGQELLTFTGHTNAIESLAYFPDGNRIVTASYDNTARIWDTKLGREVLVFRGHQRPVTCVAVSPDGRRVVTGSADRSAKVWDAETGQEQLLLQGHKEAIDGVAFSPDGRRVATTSLDQTIKIWEVATEVKTAAPGPGSEFRLESDYVPLAIRLPEDFSHREIRSVRVAGKVLAQGDGAGEIWLDTRPAELNPFGDALQRIGPEPASIRVGLRYLSTGAGETQNQALPMQDSRASKGFKLYDLVFPSGALSNCLKLVLGTTNLGPHRLLVRGRAAPDEQRRPEALTHILPLHGVPAITSVLPDAPLRREFELSGYYTPLDGRIHRLEVRGRTAGAGILVFDPNYITFDSFGEPVMSTTMGPPRHEITLKPAEGADPLGQGRKLYWAVSKDSRNTNRVAVALGRTEVGPHRVLLYRGDEVAFIVPVELADRRRQESSASETTSLSIAEQQAIADLRRTTGHGFRCDIEKGQVVGLYFSSNTGSFPPEGVLTRLPQLRSIHFGGGPFPTAGLMDLRRLAQLRSLSFDGVEFQAKALATLKDLTQLEALTFYDCRGITDEGVTHLAGLTDLKRLSFYSEQLRRPHDPQGRVTDAGVAHLKRLVRLEHLDLFGHDLSDRSVDVLTGMSELQELALSGHGLTDAGLDGLARLPKLRNLRLFETAVTTNGVAALKRRLPELQVEAWGVDSHD